MNATLAEILKGRLEDVLWIGRLAGLVRPVTYERNGGTITIPVAVSVQDRSGCAASDALREMVPDDQYGAMVYFEDLGTIRSQSRTRGVAFTSTIRLVCWVNVARLGGDILAADQVMEKLIHAMNAGPYNLGSFQGIRHRAQAFPTRGAGLFATYNYPASARQYLMPPFDAFAIDITTDYRLKAGCEEDVALEDVNCWSAPVVLPPTDPADNCAVLRVCGTPTVGDVATWDGEQWVPQAPTGGGGSPTYDTTTYPGYLFIPGVGVIPILEL